MHPLVWIPLFASVAAAAIAGAILAHDPGQRVNRLVALVLAGSVHWSLCEVIWNLSDDPEWVVQLVRLSSAGWLWMGPLCLDIYAELAGAGRSRARRLVPFAYALAAGAIVLYVSTPWCVARAVPVYWGWSFRFGPLFPLAYLPTAASVGFVLWQWPRFFASGVPLGERRLAAWLFVGIAVSMGVASTTDVLLPYLGIDAPRLGSTSLLILGSTVAWSVSRHGYLLLAPGAFAGDILETLRDGVALLHADGRIRSWNGAFGGLAGRPAALLAGSEIAELLPDLRSRELSDDMRELETRLVRMDGDRIPVAVSSSRLRDQKHDVIGRVLALRDLREVAALRSRLVTSGRLTAVGELAAGIAHEINNPITFVRSNLTHLRQEWTALAAELEKAIPDAEHDPALGEGEEMIEDSIEGIDRVAAIVRDVRAFSHAGLGQAELADVNELVENAANFAGLRYAITVERCYGDVPRVRCAPHQLRQVFLNLLFNAFQAVDESGSIRIVTQRLRDSVVVRVQDDGCGIPEGVIDRIFDPFFTTRPAGEGTGLGLALCYQIVRNHGGAISVESEPGRGTSFFVRLPPADRVD